jgi:hypothetical protein
VAHEVLDADLPGGDTSVAAVSATKVCVPGCSIPTRPLRADAATLRPSTGAIVAFWLPVTVPLAPLLSRNVPDSALPVAATVAVTVNV